MIAWFAETFASAAPLAHDPERELLDRLVTARRRLVRLASQVGQLGEPESLGYADLAGRTLATLDAVAGEITAAPTSRPRLSALF